MIENQIFFISIIVQIQEQKLGRKFLVFFIFYQPFNFNYFFIFSSPRPKIKKYQFSRCHITTTQISVGGSAQNKQDLPCCSLICV